MSFSNDLVFISDSVILDSNCSGRGEYPEPHPYPQPMPKPHPYPRPYPHPVNPEPHPNPIHPYPHPVNPEPHPNPIHPHPHPNPIHPPRPHPVNPEPHPNPIHPHPNPIHPHPNPIHPHPNPIHPHKKPHRIHPGQLTANAEDSEMNSDSGSVCDTQDDFNQAFQKAVKYVDKKNRPSGWSQVIALCIIVLLIVWALILSCRINTGNDKILHILLALVFSPFYIIAYYLNNVKKNNM